MKASLIDKLACPFDKQELQMQVYKKGPEDTVIEGILICETCKRYYPIVHGIPIMSPDEYREHALEKPLLQKWKLQLEGKFTVTENFRMLPESTGE